MSARDELSELVLHHPWLLDREDLYTGLCPECPGRKIHGGHNSPSHAEHLAEVILAAGYRKPRTITTAEELDSLPYGSVVLDADRATATRLDADYWEVGGFASNFRVEAIALPATVLYEPEVTR